MLLIWIKVIVHPLILKKNGKDRDSDLMKRYRKQAGNFFSTHISVFSIHYNAAFNSLASILVLMIPEKYST
jgi:hypothetical protein